MGVPPGKNSIDQPPPTIHSRPGFAAAYSAMMSRHCCAERGAVQLALTHREAAHHGMDVRVLEAGEEEAAGEVDDVGVGSGQRGELGLGPERRDPSLHHGHRSADRGVRAGVKHRSTGEERVDLLTHAVLLGTTPGARWPDARALSTAMSMVLT